MDLTGKNFIGSRLSGSGKSFYAENPSTAEKISTDFYEATQQEIGEAIELAARAFNNYKNKSGEEKAKFLEAIATALTDLGDALIQRCAMETGLPEARLTGERGRTVGQLRLFAQLLRDGYWVDARIDTADPGRTPLPKPDVRSMLRPLGPVGVFGASNFPLAFSVAGGDTVSALAAGCPVIFKAHPAHPGTCELVASAIISAAQKTAMPDGVFSMVHGASTEVGQTIVRHPLIKAIGFTGSFRGGKAIFDEANKRSEPIPVYAEMGSVNPVFILPGALEERGEQITRDLTASVTQGVGQFCTNPGLVFLQESEKSKSFRSSLASTFAGTTSGVMLNAMIRDNFRRGLDKLKKAAGVSELSSGKENGTGYQGTPALLESTAENFLQDHVLQEEVFGPSTLLITASNTSELERAVARLSGHLTATVHAREPHEPEA